jgi:hypothetical protein
MRHDPQLAAILKVYTLAITRARWSIDPAGCRDEVAARVADDLGLPVMGVDEEPSGARRRAFTFAEHLRLSLLDLVYGHMFFEQTYTEADGGWRLAAVQERMPQTVSEVKLNPDGTIRYVEQEAGIGSRKPTQITTADHRLVAYANEREGSNYFGRSLLRPAYGMWLIKDQVLRVHATSIRRFGMGIPYAENKPGATPQEITETARMVANLKATEHMGETIMDVMVYAQQAVADNHANTATGQIVVPLVDANWGEDEPAPRVVCEDVGADLELTAEDIFNLMRAGALIGDPQLWAWMRDRYRLPDIDEAYLPQPATEDPTSGGAA